MLSPKSLAAIVAARLGEVGQLTTENTIALSEQLIKEIRLAGYYPEMSFQTYIKEDLVANGSSFESRTTFRGSYSDAGQVSADLEKGWVTHRSTHIRDGKLELFSYSYSKWGYDREESYSSWIHPPKELCIVQQLCFEFKNRSTAIIAVADKQVKILLPASGIIPEVLDLNVWEGSFRGGDYEYEHRGAFRTDVPISEVRDQALYDHLDCLVQSEKSWSQIQCSEEQLPQIHHLFNYDYNKRNLEHPRRFMWEKVDGLRNPVLMTVIEKTYHNRKVLEIKTIYSILLDEMKVGWAEPNSEPGKEVVEINLERIEVKKATYDSWHRFNSKAAKWDCDPIPAWGHVPYAFIVENGKLVKSKPISDWEIAQAPRSTIGPKRNWWYPILFRKDQYGEEQVIQKIINRQPLQEWQIQHYAEFIDSILDHNMCRIKDELVAYLFNLSRRLKFHGAPQVGDDSRKWSPEDRKTLIGLMNK